MSRIWWCQSRDRNRVMWYWSDIDPTNFNFFNLSVTIYDKHFRPPAYFWTGLHKWHTSFCTQVVEGKVNLRTPTLPVTIFPGTRKSMPISWLLLASILMFLHIRIVETASISLRPLALLCAPIRLGTDLFVLFFWCCCWDVYTASFPCYFGGGCEDFSPCTFSDGPEWYSEIFVRFWAFWGGEGLWSGACQVFLIHYYSQCALPSVCQWWERGVEPQHVPPPHNRFSKFFAHISIGALEGSSNTNAKYM